MRLIIFLCTATLCFISCKTEQGESRSIEAKRIQNSTFQAILDSAKVTGTILVLDHSKSTYYSNDYMWSSTGKLPASTYKIINSIIALETGVIEHDSTICVWDGEPKALSLWEQDFYFKNAFRYSCVPCYQEIARNIGVHRMNAFLDTLEYHNMVVNDQTIDNFWLLGDSRITAFEQIDFLKRLHFSDLKISERTEQIVKAIMIIQQENDSILRGKTGWSIQDNVNNGWFVGYLERSGKVYFFATNIEPTDSFNMDDFAVVRRDATLRALESLGLLGKEE